MRTKRLRKIVWLLVTGYCLLTSIFTAQSFAEEQFFEVKAKKFSYEPNIIRVNKGDKVRIRLISEDVTHGFFIDGYDLDTKAHPGQEGYLSFAADKTGRYTFRCSVTCGEFHPYMVGYLIVSPNTRFYRFTVLVLILGLCSISLIIFKKQRQ